jgi:hypothetical protein
LDYADEQEGVEAHFSTPEGYHDDPVFVKHYTFNNNNLNVNFDAA